MATKNEPMGWDEIQAEFEEMQRMSCTPIGLTKLRPDFVKDEEKSVKWNREYVERENKKYHDEVARLNTRKNKARDAVTEHIYKRIQLEVGHQISMKKAAAIYNMAYDLGHPSGFYAVRGYLEELIELAYYLLD